MSTSILNFEDCDEETLKRLRHRGRANRCNTCLADDGKTVIMEKGRMEAHVYKEHVALARVPFRCTLCQFRCQDRKTLDDHVLNYKPHVKAVKAGRGQVPEDCLKESSNPYFASEEDYHVFSQDESVRIWFEQRQKKAGSRDSLSFLDAAVVDTLGSQTDLESVLPPLTKSAHVPGNESAVTVATHPQPSPPVDSTVQLLSSLLNSGLLQLGPGFDASCLQSQVQIGSLDGQKASSSSAVKPSDHSTGRQADAPVLPQETSIQTPVQDEGPIPADWSPATAFKATYPGRKKDTEGSTSTDIPIDLSVAGARRKEIMPINIAVPPAAHGSPSQKTTTQDDEALDLTTTSNVVMEDLRSQLLEEVPSIDDEDVRRVRASSVRREELFIANSPASTCSSSSSSSSDSSCSLLEFKKHVEEANRAMAAEINNNSRAVRQLQTAINEQTEIMKSVKTTLEAFVSYSRQYNREGRREQERRDVDHKREREEDIQRLDNIQLAQVSKRCRVSDELRKEEPKAMKSVLGTVYPSNRKPKK